MPTKKLLAESFLCPPSGVLVRRLAERIHMAAPHGMLHARQTASLCCVQVGVLVPLAGVELGGLLAGRREVRTLLQTAAAVSWTPSSLSSAAARLLDLAVDRDLDADLDLGGPCTGLEEREVHGATSGKAGCLASPKQPSRARRDACPGTSPRVRGSRQTSARLWRGPAGHQHFLSGSRRSTQAHLSLAPPPWSL